MRWVSLRGASDAASDVSKILSGSGCALQRTIVGLSGCERCTIGLNCARFSQPVGYGKEASLVLTAKPSLRGKKKEGEKDGEWKVYVSDYGPRLTTALANLGIREFLCNGSSSNVTGDDAVIP